MPNERAVNNNVNNSEKNVIVRNSSAILYVVVVAKYKQTNIMHTNVYCGQ